MRADFSSQRRTYGTFGLNVRVQNCAKNGSTKKLKKITKNLLFFETYIYHRTYFWCLESLGASALSKSRRLRIYKMVENSRCRLFFEEFKTFQTYLIFINQLFVILNYHCTKNKLEKLVRFLNFY